MVKTAFLGLETQLPVLKRGSSQKTEEKIWIWLFTEFHHLDVIFVTFWLENRKLVKFAFEAFKTN